MNERPALGALAERLGIYFDYWRIDGTHCPTADRTRELLLTAMGLDVSTERSAERELAEREDTERRRTVDPVQVVRTDERRIHALDVRLRAPAEGPYRLELSSAEHGGAQGDDAVLATVRLADGHAAARFEIPGGLATGYYRVRCTPERPSANDACEQFVIVAPMRCFDPRTATGGARAFGISANLYTVRGAGNWGIGDIGALRELAEWIAQVGGDFVGINPLHTIDHRSEEPAPYFPVSRLFRSPGYIEVPAVPEFATSEIARRMLERPATRAELARLRATSSIEYTRVTELKLAALSELHREFTRAHGEGTTDRGRRYREYLERTGGALDDFATYSAISDGYADGRASAVAGGPVAGDWNTWPAEFRDSTSEEIARFRDANAERIDFHRYLQFLLSEQLAGAASAGREAGLRVGLFQDLALGAAPGSADTWAFPRSFARGATVGAPPDQFSPQGQNWALPPLVPSVEREQQYGYWRALLRSSFESSGALRIDHAMGLARQFWIAEGLPTSEGTYVAYPAEELLAVLCVESARARAAVIAEDLGTVPEGFREQIGDHGLLRTVVMYFERDSDGAFRAAEHYPADALATVNTHDLVPLAGYWSAADIELRTDAGRLDTADRARALEGRSHERRALAEVLGLDERDIEPEQAASILTRETNAFLDRTPSVLAAVSLDDLAGEHEPVNVPGPPIAGRRNWARRASMTLAELRESREVRAALAAFPSRKRDPSPSQD